MVESYGAISPTWF